MFLTNFLAYLLNLGVSKQSLPVLYLLFDALHISYALRSGMLDLYAKLVIFTSLYNPVLGLNLLKLNRMLRLQGLDLRLVLLQIILLSLLEPLRLSIVCMLCPLKHILVFFLYK